MESDVRTRSQNYFHNLNPLSQKFAKDIENTREAYQDLWKTLSAEEQNQVINESIITPTAVLQYAHIRNPIIHDPSTTYSWFTKSQLDLFTCFKPNEAVIENRTSQLPCISTHEAVQKVAAEIKKKDKNEESKHSLPGEVQSQKSSVLKPKAPPPPPPIAKTKLRGDSSNGRSFPVELTGSNEISNEIRKTGFDFLDNW